MLLKADSFKVAYKTLLVLASDHLPTFSVQAPRHTHSMKATQAFPRWPTVQTPGTMSALAHADLSINRTPIVSVESMLNVYYHVYLL